MNMFPVDSSHRKLWGHLETCDVITNREMMSFLRDMFEFVKMGGVKVDHNAAMREILSELK